MRYGRYEDLVKLYPLSTKLISTAIAFAVDGGEDDIENLDEIFSSCEEYEIQEVMISELDDYGVYVETQHSTNDIGFIASVFDSINKARTILPEHYSLRTNAVDDAIETGIQILNQVLDNELENSLTL